MWVTGPEDRSTGDTESPIVISEVKGRFRSLTVINSSQDLRGGKFQQGNLCFSVRFAQEIIPQKRHNLTLS